MTSKSIDYWDKMEESQWFPIEKVKNNQIDKLNRLLAYSIKYVPYYQNLFKKNNIIPSQISSFKEFEKVPFLLKETVKSNSSKMFSNKLDMNKVLKIRTSGSTGMPLHIFADIDQLNSRYAAVLRYWGWAGWKIGDRSIRLWHQKIGMKEDEIRKEWIDSYLLNRKYIPVFNFNDKNMMKYLMEIIDYKPMIMDGYAEAFDILAEYINVNNLKNVFVPAIISSAQMLSPSMRKNIETQFHSKVFDRYGCREFSTVAHECELHKGYHITAENLIVEIIKDGRSAKDNEVGEVVLTDLNNYSQPMIRYKIGDLAKKIREKCTCGRGLPLIGKIHGRSKGVVVGMNGKYLTTSFFLHFLKDYDEEIRQFQVIQEERDLLIIKIIPQGKIISKNVLKIISNNMKKFLGEKMLIEFDFVSEIKMVKTGKHQAVISKVPFLISKSETNLI